MRLVLAMLVVVALGAAGRDAAAQHEHHHGTGQTPGHAAGHGEHAHHAPRFEAGLAVEAATVEGGAYQGVAPTLAWTPGRFGLRVVVPTYHLARNGFGDTGLGDVIVSGHAQLVGGHGWALGAVASVGAPTGNADTHLGMGHYMVMPSLFVAAQRGRASFTVHLGGGKSLGGETHMGHVGAIVSPMNATEVGGSVRAGLAVADALSIHGTAGVAVPIGDGVTRSTAGAGARHQLAGVDVGVELHVPLAGDPYRVRLVADVAYRF